MPKKCRVIVGNAWPDCKPIRCGKPATAEPAIEDIYVMIAGMVDTPNGGTQEVYEGLRKKKQRYYYFCSEHKEEWQRMSCRLFNEDECPDCLQAHSGLCAECEHSEKIANSEMKHG